MLVWFLISLILSIASNIIFLKSKKSLKQVEREEGLASHKVKNGTKTMAGIIFVIIPCLLSIIYLIIKKEFIFEVFFLSLTYFLFGIVGFIDDFLKVVKKNNLGLSSRLKMILLILVSGLLFFLLLTFGYETSVVIFNFQISMGFFYGLFILFMYASVTNACNFTDGIDGLCGGVSLIILIGFIIISNFNKNDDVLTFILIVVASILAFYHFNFPKAKFFMGDTGSLAIGGLLTSLAIIFKTYDVFIFMCLIFIFEALSVVVQIIYFKLTKGKRIFLMSPLHHHLELRGHKEIIINIIFYIAQIIALYIGLLIGGFI